MAVLPIDKLSAGMQISEDVVSPQGMLICKAGQSISEKHLKAFKAWGVTEVRVHGGEAISEAGETSGAAAERSSKSEIVEEASRLFSRTDMNDPVIAELFQLVTDRKLMQ